MLSSREIGLAAATAVGTALLVTGIFVVADRSGATSAGGADEFCPATKVAPKVMPSVVTIYANDAKGPAGSGSGEFIDTGGHVLTNNHVISSAVNGGSVTVLRPNGESLQAELVGRDIQTDLAVLKVTPESPVTPIKFDTRESPRIGEQVFAVGAPLGLSDTMTAGIIGGLGRTVNVPADGGATALLISALQTDASINPGNSGGTLANCAGVLVGVPTAGATASDSAGVPVAGSIGLGFAIPAATAQRIADELISEGRVAHADFGLSVAPVTSASEVSTATGLFVTVVDQGGPVDQAGVRVGDVLTVVDGRHATSAQLLQEISLTRSAGESVDVEFVRDGKTLKATVKLQVAPAPH